MILGIFLIFFAVICKFNRHFAYGRTVHRGVRYLTRTTLVTHIYSHQDGDDTVNSINTVDLTRGAIHSILENFWIRVSQLIPQETLLLCEDELKGATSLLILATIRRSADTDLKSRLTVEKMLKEADVNNDGHLSFIEWYDWLGGQDLKSSLDANINDDLLSENTRNMDPMVISLGQVLSHAVCAVKVATRLENDPFTLSAAFVGGGILSGVLDTDIALTMLSRLSPQTRDLVTVALALEGGSVAVPMLPKIHAQAPPKDDGQSASERLFFDRLARVNSAGSRLRAGSTWGRLQQETTVRADWGGRHDTLMQSFPSSAAASALPSVSAGDMINDMQSRQPKASSRPTDSNSLEEVKQSSAAAKQSSAQQGGVKEGVAALKSKDAVAAARGDFEILPAVELGSIPILRAPPIDDTAGAARGAIVAAGAFQHPNSQVAADLPTSSPVENYSAQVAADSPTSSPVENYSAQVAADLPILSPVENYSAQSTNSIVGDNISASSRDSIVSNDNQRSSGIDIGVDVGSRIGSYDTKRGKLRDVSIVHVTRKPNSMRSFTTASKTAIAGLDLSEPAHQRQFMRATTTGVAGDRLDGKLEDVIEFGSDAVPNKYQASIKVAALDAVAMSGADGAAAAATTTSPPSSTTVTATTFIGSTAAPTADIRLLEDWNGISSSIEAANETTTEIRAEESNQISSKGNPDYEVAAAEAIGPSAHYYGLSLVPPNTPRWAQSQALSTAISLRRRHGAEWSDAHPSSADSTRWENSRRRSSRSNGSNSGSSSGSSSSSEEGAGGADNFDSLSVNFEDAFTSATRFMDDIQQMRMQLADLDDGNAALMRKALLAKAGGRMNVLSLAMALRAARLQHATILEPALKQRLAMETLQIWAPLSYQVGLAKSTPELEVHSYVLLFPRSFGSFVNTYTQFRPLARQIRRKVHSAIAACLAGDELLPLLAVKVDVQCRLKTPASAFKKMVKGFLTWQQLHDLIGMRIIVTERADIDDYLLLRRLLLEQHRARQHEEQTKRRDVSRLSRNEVQEQRQEPGRIRSFEDENDKKRDTESSTESNTESNTDEDEEDGDDDDNDSVWEGNLNTRDDWYEYASKETENNTIETGPHSFSAATSSSASASSARINSNSSPSSRGADRDGDVLKFQFTFSDDYGNDSDGYDGIFSHDCIDEKTLDLWSSVKDQYEKETAVWYVRDLVLRLLTESWHSTRTAHRKMGSTRSAVAEPAGGGAQDSSVHEGSAGAGPASGEAQDSDEDDDDEGPIFVGEWQEKASRFKDYVTVPKSSGYQSLHMTLEHRHTNTQMEIQIRSSRMHWAAEASHNSYKALLLPTMATDTTPSTSNAAPDSVDKGVIDQRPLPPPGT